MLVGGGEILQMKGIFTEQLNRETCRSDPDWGTPWLGKQVGGKLKNRSRCCACEFAQHLPSPCLVKTRWLGEAFIPRSWLPLVAAATHD